MVARPDMLALTADRLFTPIEDLAHPLVLIENGHIVEVTTAEARAIPPAARQVALPGGVLAPGFVDLHIHGGAGHDVMENDASGLSAIETLLARHGVSSYFPTTVTAPEDVTLRALDRLAGAIEQAAPDPVMPGGRPLGLPLGGPFPSHTRPRAHLPAA